MAEVAPPLADLVLVDRCLEGEQAAARELFRVHQGRVQASLYRVLGSNRDMDDLLQETFIQVFKSLPRFRGESRLATWIDRIAVRVAYKYIARKKNQRLTLTVDEDMPVQTVEPTDRMVAREGVRRLYRALDQLSPAARIAFSLHAIDGRSVAEVADCIGASVTATKLRIWRARRALYKHAASDAILAQFLEESP